MYSVLILFAYGDFQCISSPLFVMLLAPLCRKQAHNGADRPAGVMSIEGSQDNGARFVLPGCPSCHGT